MPAEQEDRCPRDCAPESRAPSPPADTVHDSEPDDPFGFGPSHLGLGEVLGNDAEHFPASVAPASPSGVRGVVRREDLCQRDGDRDPRAPSLLADSFWDDYDPDEAWRQFVAAEGARREIANLTNSDGDPVASSFDSLGDDASVPTPSLTFPISSHDAPT